MKNLYLILFIIVFLVACNRSEKSRILEDEHVVEFLKRNGDKLVVPREVFHWIYFKTEEDAENFINQTKKKNFVLFSKSKVQDSYPFRIGIKREDKVDLKSVNKYSLYLLELAEKNNGDYDGWETHVQK